MRRSALMLAAMALTLSLASGVALAVNRVGTDRPDTLRGTNGSDNLLGMGGNDRLFSLDGRDNLHGGSGKDVVFGGDERFRLSGGDKNLDGGTNNDFVNGGRGSDNIFGQRGNDLLGDGVLRESSEDNLSGGGGNDVILADNKPAARDVIVCGDGFDRVLADTRDTVARDCERVTVVRGSRENITRQEQRFFQSVPQSFFDGLPNF